MWKCNWAPSSQKSWLRHCKPMCISPHIDNLQTFVIEGSIGLYPLVLLGFLYIQLKLHDHGCRVVTVIWKPFHFCISRFCQSLDIRSSLINTCATFFLLSYMKTGYPALYILLPARVWSPNGSHKMFWRVRRGGTVYYCSLHNIIVLAKLCCPRHKYCMHKTIYIYFIQLLC